MKNNMKTVITLIAMASFATLFPMVVYNDVPDSKDRNRTIVLSVSEWERIKKEIDVRNVSVLERHNITIVVTNAIPLPPPLTVPHFFPSGGNANGNPLKKRTVEPVPYEE